MKPTAIPRYRYAIKETRIEEIGDRPVAGTRRANWRSVLVSTSIYDRPPLRHQIKTKPERTSHTRSTLDPTSIGVHRTCWGSRRVVKCKNYSEPMLISTGFWLFRRGQNMEFCFEDRVSSRILGQAC
jgi:hypothetical protein